MVRNMLNGSKKVCGEIREIVSQWLKQRTVLATIEGVQVGYGIFDGMLEQHDGAIVEWMSPRSSWFDPGYFNG